MKRTFILLMLPFFLAGCITKHTPVVDFEAALDAKESAKLVEYLKGYGVLMNPVVNAIKTGDSSKWQFKIITNNSYNYKIIELTTTSLDSHLLLVCKKDNNKWNVIGSVAQKTKNNISPDTTMYQTSDNALIFYIVKCEQKSADEERQVVNFYKATSYVRKALGAEWNGGEYTRFWRCRVEFDQALSKAPIKIIYSMEYYQPINPDSFKPSELVFSKERTASYGWSPILGRYLFDGSKSDFSRLELYSRFKPSMSGLYDRYKQELDEMLSSGSENQKKWVLTQKGGGKLQ